MAEIISPHFDEAFYVAQDPSLAESPISLIEHFILTGWRQSLDPNSQFSTDYYLEKYPEVAEANVNPLVHYIQYGRDEGRRSSATQVIWGTPLALLRSVTQAGLDEEFYWEQYPEALESGISALDHYLELGWQEGKDPNSEFSTNFYVRTYPQVIAAGMHPLYHYEKFGRSEGRLCKEMKADASTSTQDEAAIQTDFVISESEVLHDPIATDLKPHFDQDYYLSVNSDVANAGVDPLQHFIHNGWKEGRDPNPEFSVKFYLDTNSDVKESGLNPFWHYIAAGRSEGRTGKPTSDDMIWTGRINDIQDAFDADFYLSKYPDIALSGIDPLEHYCLAGWKEGRDPSIEFSTSYYLHTHPDIVSSGLNPFWHYVVAGKREGRSASHPGGYKATTLMATLPLEMEADAISSKQALPRLISVKDLLKALNPNTKSATIPLTIAISHDHFIKVTGGVQLCIQAEQKVALDSGERYLNVHPFYPLPRLQHERGTEAYPVSLVLNGKDIGTCKMSDLIKATTEIARKKHRARIVVHHPLGHRLESIGDLIMATGLKECWLWLHDFFSICTSYTLQRNNVNYCGAPPKTSNACTLCRFGEERINQIERFKKFFDRFEVNVLAPSEVAQDFWTKRSGLSPHSIRVVPHVQFEPTSKKATVKSVKQGPVRVAFLGTPAPHKGWQVFVKLMKNTIDSGQFSFFFFGSNPPGVRELKHVPIHVKIDQPDAMVEAVSANEIDLVIHWASWPETFSLSTFEAISGHAFVLTNPVSGNVASAVQRFGRGAVLKDDSDLLAFFEDGRAEKMSKQVRSKRLIEDISYQLSRMTFEVLNAGGQRK